MREFIHGETLKEYFEGCFSIDVEINRFTDNNTKETNYVVYKKASDLAIFSDKGNGNFVAINSSGEPIREDNIFAFAKDEFVKSENGSIMFKTENLRVELDGDILDNDNLSRFEEEIYPERTNISLKTILFRNKCID